MRFPELYRTRLAQREAEKRRRQGARRKPARSGVTSEFGILRAYVDQSPYHRRRIESLVPQKGKTMFTNLKSAMALREVRGYRLAAEVGITPTVLSEIVYGRRAAAPELRAKIAARLEADEAWLFTPTRIVPARQTAGGGTAHAAA